MENKVISYLLEKEKICYLDYHFAKFATGLTGKDETAVLLAAVLVSSKTREGHICIDLSEYAETDLIEGDENTRLPELSRWVNILKASRVVGMPGDFKPLILDEKNRLYLFRYWAYEKRIAEHIRKYVNQITYEDDLEEISSRLDELFTKKEDCISPDLQKLAAYTAIVKKLCVISGGPGTGKTTTVAKILALLIASSFKPQKKENTFNSNESKDDSSKSDSNLVIGLAAPTGKAAARLQESIKSFKERVRKEKLNISDEILDLIPEETSTIHRLLGSIPNSPYFRHNKKNPLRLDILVLDEASMIDVALMSKLLEALPENTKLIILGDKDQLSSVEAGKFLGDVCTSALESSYSLDFYNVIKDITGFPPEGEPSLDKRPSLRECFIHLKESHRFGPNSGIGILSNLINSGNIDKSVTLLKEGRYSDVLIKNISDEALLFKELKKAVLKHYKKYLSAEDPKTVFMLFEQFRVLCAMREGPFGVKSVNDLIESVIKAERLTEVKKDWYKGMPIMITQNNYSLDLFNGDIGIVLPDPASNGKLKAYFTTPDGKFRKFHQLRLPEYEKVYAMTVHKSQGSEFDNIVLILPEKPYPVLTRELLYTGLTRAKLNAEIWSSEKIFASTIEKNIKRSSGLYDSLMVSY
ncbi:MAG: exodeoxyribonuclease V subunit alpha [Bacteroidota bacterium]|nr:exodeoxyribonuclease V subunit alpha [Bacteroidota bacterium]